MKRVSIIILSCIVSAFTIVTYIYFQSAQKSLGNVQAHPLKSEKSLPKGAYIYHDRKLLTAYDARVCTMYLPSEHYSKETLERIFQWYSQKYPDEMSALQMTIYTDKDTMGFYMTRRFTDGGGYTEQLGATYIRSPIFDSCGEINEHYNYSPENNYRHYKNGYGVALRGCPDFLPEAVKKWTSRNDGVEIQLSCVISRYSPSKYYYQLYCSNFSEGTAVMSMYNPDPNLQPEKNLHFLGGGKIYFYFGWKYAISLDNGKTWDIWSADRKLKDFQAGEYNLIKQVNIETNGTGKMELDRDKETSKYISSLFTTDYGRTWVAN